MQSIAWFIGLRYHRVKHHQGFISFISASSVLGIMLGVAVLIIGLSVMNGFERELSQRFLSIIPHGELEAVKQPLLEPEKTRSLALEHPAVEGAAPYIALQGLVQKGKKMRPLSIKGVDPLLQDQVSYLPRYVEPLAWEQLQQNSPNIVLGAGLAKQLQAKVGEQITLLLPSDPEGQSLRSPQRVRVQLIGVMEAGGQLDQQLAFINIDYARSLMPWTNSEGVSGISLRLKDPLQANHVVREVAMTYPQLVYVKNWMRSHGYLYQDIQMVRSIMYVIMLLIVAVASFNIVSTLILAVSEKKSDIAILKTMGASNGSLMRTFVIYGAYNGVIGCALGTVFGLLGTWVLPRLSLWIEALIGRKLLSGDIYFIDFIPVSLQLTDVAFVLFSALSLSLIATLWPAWQATKIQPAQVLA